MPQSNSRIRIGFTTASAQSTQLATEQRLQQLDKLAAGGYITPAEYKAKRRPFLTICDEAAEGKRDVLRF